jgi:hypothetical protein
MKKALLVVIVVLFVIAAPLSVTAEPNHGNGLSWCFGWGFFWHHFGWGWHHTWNNPPVTPPLPPAEPADPKGGDGSGAGGKG